jgi:release factor glutamine methyltransferase
MGNFGTAWRAIQQQLEHAGLAPAPHEGKTLLAHVVRCSPHELILSENAALTPPQAAALEALVAQRLTGMPLAYVLGHAWFYGLQFEVSPAVLIPRPDTEVLVQAVLDNVAQDAEILGLEVGTGSGAVVAALATSLPRSRWWASEISDDAAQLARRNITALCLTGRVEVVVADVLPLSLSPLHILVSNPPYISENTYKKLDTGVTNHEPKLALTGATPNPDGLLYYRRLAALRGVMQPKGLLALEIGATQGAAVGELLAEHGWNTIQTLPDLAGRPRVVLARA